MLFQHIMGGSEVTANVLRATVSHSQANIQYQPPAMQHAVMQGNHLSGSVGAGTVGVTAITMNTGPDSNVEQAIAVRIDGLPPAMAEMLTQHLTK